MKTVLFVCTANMCRSPIAEGLMQDKLRREKRDGEFRAESAGVWTVNGRPATGLAVAVLAGRGIDISGHRSRVITEETIRDAALILTMTRSHAEAICAEFPAYRNRVFLLSEMVGGAFDIEDPVGGTLQQYEMTTQDLENLIEQGYPRMMKVISGQ
jgi:protein-tyrosine-phosphatase